MQLCQIFLKKEEKEKRNFGVGDLMLQRPRYVKKNQLVKVIQKST